MMHSIQVIVLFFSSLFFIWLLMTSKTNKNIIVSYWSRFTWFGKKALIDPINMEPNKKRNLVNLIEVILPLLFKIKMYT